MNCPIDNTQLAIAERNGVEIDYCPQCRGVWLDRGELDKIIEKADIVPTRSQQPDTRYREDYDKSRHHDSHHKKKRESFLGDLFDF